MQFLDHLRSRLVLAGRVTMWVAVALLVLVGLLHNAPAWAATDAECPGNSTSPHPSIPIAPIKLYLIYGGPAQTYTVSLCKTPNQPVVVTVKASPKNDVIFAPTKLTLSNTVSQTVSVTVDNKHKATVPFEVTLTHSGTSKDKDWDYGTLKVPVVTAYYSPPVGIKDIYVVQGVASFKLPVLANDTDRRGLGLLLKPDAITIPPNRGTATVNADNTIQYQTSTKKAGSDIFYYRVNDFPGNTDIGKVHIIQAPPGAQFPAAFYVDMEDGGSPILPASGVQLDVPPLTGVSPDADVACAIAQVVSTDAVLDSAPLVPSVFTGLAFYLECSVDGKEVTADMLSAPVRVLVPMNMEFHHKYGSSNLTVLNWDGAAWHTDGINSTLSSNETTLIVKITRFGEFDVFGQFHTNFPFVRVPQ